MEITEKWIRFKYKESPFSITTKTLEMSNRDFHKWLNENKNKIIIEKYYFYTDIDEE